MEAGPDKPAQSDKAEQRQSKNPRWLPLESNPAIFNGFLERVGMPPGWRFTDVLGLDEELLAMVPQPVAAVCLLFPSKPIRGPRREALATQQETRRAPSSTFFLTQHRDFGNACGTIAAMHVIGNLTRSGTVELIPGSPAERFLLQVAGKDADGIGWELADATELHEASEAAARSREAQTRTPGRNDKVDGHFVVFVAVEGRLIELDGTMGSAIAHQEVACGRSLLSQAACIIQTEFMARAPGNPNFSVLALTAGTFSSSMSASASAMQEGPVASDICDEKVQALVAMGFPEAAARAALAAANGSADAAAEMLLCG